LPGGFVVKDASRDPSRPEGGGGGGSGGQPALPGISLPRGGGAIRGIDEKFSVNSSNGTGSLSLNIPTSSGRAGFTPALTLSYDSGSGNGPFGFGWSLGLAAIARKTDKGLPEYHDGRESDVFVLSGAEDLVPELAPDADRRIDTPEGPADYVVRRYRPRIEGNFSRIERWTRSDGDIHWRTISGDNILSLYGADARSRIADPADPRRIFRWLISESRDDRGNAVLYDYRAEDAEGLDLAAPEEANRGPATGPARRVNRYLKRIRYCNRTSLLDAEGARPARLGAAALAATQWMFEIVFDYGDHDPADPAPRDDEARNADGTPRFAWPVRPDPFSGCRSGFEVRTLRLCRRVLCFHHMPGDGEMGAPTLVRSMDFSYAGDGAAGGPGYSLLVAAKINGYRRAAAGRVARALPPVTFRYSRAVIGARVEEPSAQELEGMPVSAPGVEGRWIDLLGEGLSGCLYDDGQGWYYQRNLSPLSGSRDGDVQPTAHFAPAEPVREMPRPVAGEGERFLDLAGDGLPDLALLDPPVQGFYEQDGAGGWASFQPFAAPLRRNLADPSLRFVDLTGDGLADVVLADSDALLWHESLGEAGFGPARRVFLGSDAELAPQLFTGGGTGSLHFADMDGDGLSDLVWLSDGAVSYWPNLGYGRFGARIVMRDAPSFDETDQFDPARLRLADIDGSGTADLVYLHRAGVKLAFNRSGNGWSEPITLSVPVRAVDPAKVAVIDLLGNGTGCLVWSSSLPGDRERPIRYVKLMAQGKPYLLTRLSNHMGAETRISYAPSTRFYLEDRKAGRDWQHKLPFPVHVVERVENLDHIGRTRFISRYAYHDGYFDGAEREFRGFGVVDQWDTEEFAVLAGGAPLAGVLEDEAGLPANIDPASHVPPVLTRRWFHLGGFGEMEDAGRAGAFREPGLSDGEAAGMFAVQTIPPPGLSPEEKREAMRALKGVMLRQEVFAEDAGAADAPERRARARVPYSVTEQGFSLRLLQPRADNRHAAFLVHPAETIDWLYERDPADPRCTHRMVLEADDHGNVLKEATIGYARRATLRVVQDDGTVRTVANPALAALEPRDRARQATTLVTYSEMRVASPAAAADAFRTPLPCENITWELTGYAATGPGGRYLARDLVERDPDPAARGRLRLRPGGVVAYEAPPLAGPCRRPIEWLRTLYRADDLSGLSPLGEVGMRALPGQGYRLAFTPGLIASVLQRPGPAGDVALLPDPAAVLGGAGADRGGYVSGEALVAAGLVLPGEPPGQWWLASSRSFFSPDPGATPDAELAEARAHFFLPRRIRDPFDEDVTVTYDAYDLLPAEWRDALGNTTVAEVNDYRVLSVRRMRDANGNRSEAAFDALGRVAGTARMGKAAPAPVEGDSLDGFDPDSDLSGIFDAASPAAAAQLLGKATSRVLHDLDRFERSRAAAPLDPAAWQPSAVGVLERETHAAPLAPGGAPPPTRIKLAIAYCDGFGQEVQRTSRIGPGPVEEGGPEVDPRWLTSGWTVFDNKGRPVRHYEPFFSAVQAFQFAATIGVSPILFYDPLGRNTVTLYPNGAYDKAVFDAWSETQYDTNDTAAARGAETGQPGTDPDTAGQVAAYLAALAAAGSPWRSWVDMRRDGALGPEEAIAATRASAHSDTPGTQHFDVLGRPFLAVSRNRTVCAGHPRDGTEEVLFSRTDLDIEGNALETRDPVVGVDAPHGRLILRTAFDLLGRPLRQESLDAGTRWQLPDAAGGMIRSWDARGHAFTERFDALRRLVSREVSGEGPLADPRTLGRTVLLERTDYGEAAPDAERLNLRTRPWRSFDGAGVFTHARLGPGGAPAEAYDFKGNALATTRQLVADYRALPDWSQPVALAQERYETRNRYDALDRAVMSVPPRAAAVGTPLTVVQMDYDDVDRLARLDVWLDRDAVPDGRLDPSVEAPSAAGVSGIVYNARGQHEAIHLANGAVTEYRYDPLTFRLARLFTRRPAAFAEDAPAPDWPGRGVQDLIYTYDPIGNVTHVRDEAQQAVFFRNRRVVPDGDFVHDALYRLIEARGREHLGQGGGPSFGNDVLRLPHPGDGQALSPYVERYLLDPTGGLSEIVHRTLGTTPASWTRRFVMAEPGRIEGHAATRGNGLSHSALAADAGAEVEERLLHDVQGQVRRLPHLGGAEGEANLFWHPDGCLSEADLGGGGRAFFTYDQSGERVRKVWEKSGNLIEERIYLGGIEIFRRHAGAIGAADPVLERETLHVLDGTRLISLVETRRRDAAGNDPAPRQLIRHQLGDRLGNVAVELDEAARIISYEEYSPYGGSTYQAARNLTELPRRYRYAAKEKDEETGLVYFGARYYAPRLGRWISPDPSGLADGPNPYVYARANPVTFTDPDGALSGGDFNPQSIAAAAAALAQAANIVRAAAAAGTTGAALTTTAAGAMGATAPAAGAGAGAAAGAGVALIAAAAVVTAAALALAVQNYMVRSANIVRYGNPWGVPRTDTAFPVMRLAREMRNQPFPVPQPLPAPKPGPQPNPKDKDKEERKPNPGRIYVTYTKYNKKTKRTYSGRTSMVIDLNKPWAPQADAAVAARDRNHHIDDEQPEPLDPDFGPAKRDEFAVGYAVNYDQRYRDAGYLAIRGREQQLIDYHGKQKADELGIKSFSGGAISDTRPGTQLTENGVRGIGKDNPLRKLFHDASNLAFGEKGPFTGDPVK
jgi:RHS repeat-associated protein